MSYVCVCVCMCVRNKSRQQRTKSRRTGCLKYVRNKSHVCIEYAPKKKIMFVLYYMSKYTISYLYFCISFIFYSNFYIKCIYLSYNTCVGCFQVDTCKIYVMIIVNKIIYIDTNIILLTRKFKTNDYKTYSLSK